MRNPSNSLESLIEPRTQARRISRISNQPSAPTASSQYWDVNGALAGLGGSGTWDTTTPFWNNSTGTSTPLPWSNGNDAFFSGTAGAVAVGTAITAGQLNFTVASYVISGGSTVTLNSTGTGSASAISATNGTGTTTITAPLGLGAGSGTTQTFNQTAGGTLAINSVISGASNLAIAGGGTVTFGGASANTYAGTTTIGSATLVVNNVGGSGTGTGLVTVNNSGTLGGTGTIGGAVVINGGGVITGGTNGTVGTLTLNSTATFSSTGTYQVDILAATSDRLTITSSLDLSGTNDAIAFAGTPDGTSSYVLAAYSSHNGIFDTVTALPTGYTLSYGTNELDLVPVPEPTTWITAALAVCVLAWSRRGWFSKSLRM